MTGDEVGGYLLLMLACIFVAGLVIVSYLRKR